MRRLPDGTCTEDIEEYARAWDALMEPLKVLGWRPYGSNPTCSFFDSRDVFVQLTVEQVMDITSAIEKGTQRC